MSAVDHVYCRECGAAAGHRCTTAKSGKPCKDHAARVKAARLVERPPSPVSYVHGRKPDADPRDGRAAVEIPSEIDVLVEDARRVARNRTFGIVDDTLDPVTVCSELAREIDRVFDECYTQEQWDELGSAHQDELDIAKREVEDAKRERTDAEERREAAEGKAEQLEVDLRLARSALDLAVADAIAAKDRALALERELTARSGCE